MSADCVPTTSLNVVCSHGSKKHNVAVHLPENETSLTCKHLFDSVLEATGIPLNRQRLIFKGKSLTSADQPLGELNMKDGARLMLLTKAIACKDGETATEEQEALFAVDREIEAKEESLHEFSRQISGLYQETLENKTQKKLDVRIKSVEEDLMKLLERLDAMSADSRNRRKELVTKIQALLQRCDQLTQQLKSITIET